MVVLIPDKAYFRIGEASKILGVAPYVIRYWEKEFKNNIKPIRTSAAQRLYRKKDVEELLVIKELLYTKKFTISGARKHLSETSGQTITDRVVAADDERERLLTIKRGLLEIRDQIRKN